MKNAHTPRLHSQEGHKLVPKKKVDVFTLVIQTADRLQATIGALQSLNDSKGLAFTTFTTFLNVSDISKHSLCSTTANSSAVHSRSLRILLALKLQIMVYSNVET